MKTAALACLILASCAVDEVTVTESSKGGLTTTTTRKSRKVDPQAWTFAKIGAEYITRREIEDRWKPTDEK